MPVPKLIDEINRLFDEMVRDPWLRPSRLPARIEQPADRTHFEVEIPSPGSQRGDVSLAIEGRRLTVTVRRRLTETKTGRGRRVTTGRQEQLQRSFVLPEGADVDAVEARFEGDVLRVRIALAAKGAD